MRIYELLRGKGFDVITVRPTTSVSEALALLKEYNLGAVVVSTDGKANLRHHDRARRGASALSRDRTFSTRRSRP